MKPENTQEDSIRKLEREGFTFSNWISACNPEFPEQRCAVMVKHPYPGSTFYAEVYPNGATSI